MKCAVLETNLLKSKSCCYILLEIDVNIGINEFIFIYVNCCKIYILLG